MKPPCASRSHVSHIRAFLNRLIGLSPGQLDLEEEDEAHTSAFDLGDETGNATDAVEGGAEFSKPTPNSKTTTETEGEKRAQSSRRRRANREQLVGAVADLAATVAEKAEGSGLHCVDLLRLRAILMVLAAAGWDGKAPPKNALQVLPEFGDMEGAWPRLIGKTLFAYFGGRRKAIATLVLDDLYDQIPDDILECWASCIWAIQVTILAASRHREYLSLSRALESLRISIYEASGMRQEEMQEVRVLRVLDALSNRFGPDLGCHGAAILTAHQQAAKILPSSALFGAGSTNM